MLHIYGIKNCDSVKRAVAFFKKHNISYTFHDFKSEAASCEEIDRWLASVEMKLLLNTKSSTYRNLKLKELNLDDGEKREWLCRENLLIKRPVVEYGDEVFVGFNEENYTRSFL